MSTKNSKTLAASFVLAALTLVCSSAGAATSRVKSVECRVSGAATCKSQRLLVSAGDNPKLYVYSSGGIAGDWNATFGVKTGAGVTLWSKTFGDTSKTYTQTLPKSGRGRALYAFINDTHNDVNNSGRGSIILYVD